MKVRDCFELNPLKNKNTFKDFINYIDTSSVQNGTLINVSFLENEFPSRAQRIVKYNDILYSSVRPNLRHYYLYQDDFEHAVASTGFVLLRRKNNCNIKFIFYYLSTNEVVKHLSNIAEMSQSTFPSFSSKDLGKIDLPIIDEYKQKSIVDILACYDSLIENNNKRIKTLEQMAENLYKEWFVRFRFPGHENAEFENGIPKGWEYYQLNSIAQIEMGQSPESKYFNYEGKGLPFHQGVGGYGGLYLVDEVYSSQGKRYAEPNSIIFSVRAPVGRLNISLNRIILGRGVASINSKDKNNWFLFSMLKNRFNSDDMIGNGSIFASVKKEELQKQKFLIPPKKLIDQFDSFGKTIEKQIRTIYYSNNNLIKQRDLLLPRLMSGKLEV